MNGWDEKSAVLFQNMTEMKKQKGQIGIWQRAQFEFNSSHRTGGGRNQQKKRRNVWEVPSSIDHGRRKWRRKGRKCKMRWKMKSFAFFMARKMLQKWTKKWAQLHKHWAENGARFGQLPSHFRPEKNLNQTKAMVKAKRAPAQLANSNRGKRSPTCVRSARTSPRALHKIGVRPARHRPSAVVVKVAKVLHSLCGTDNERSFDLDDWPNRKWKRSKRRSKKWPKQNRLKSKIWSEIEGRGRGEGREKER